MKEKLFDAAIIIAILTGISYGVTYQYQESYLAYYYLPSMFINLNINTITPVLVIVGSILTIFFGLSVRLSYEPKVSHFLSKIKSEMSNITTQIMGFFVLLIAIFIGAFYLGNLNASGQTNYIVIQQKDGFYVELTTYQEGYSNLMVVAPINIKTDTMTPKFKTIDVKELNNDQVVHFENGLKVAKLMDSQKLQP